MEDFGILEKKLSPILAQHPRSLMKDHGQHSESEIGLVLQTKPRLYSKVPRHSRDAAFYPVVEVTLRI